MPKERRCHGIPLIRTLNKKNDLNIRRWRKKQTTPLKITKRNLQKIIDEIKGGDDSKPKHKLITQYGAGAENALNMCVLPSLEPLTFSPSSILLHSASTLLHQLRKSLLNHDWNFSSQLLQLLLQSKLINTRFLLYIIRTALIILLNNCEQSEILEEFLNLTLGLNNEVRINQFLRGIFVFPKEMKTRGGKPRKCIKLSTQIPHSRPQRSKSKK